MPGLQGSRSGIFIVNFEHISHLVLVFLLLTFYCYTGWGHFLQYTKAHSDICFILKKINTQPKINCRILLEFSISTLQTDFSYTFKWIQKVLYDTLWELKIWNAVSRLMQTTSFRIKFHGNSERDLFSQINLNSVQY